MMKYLKITLLIGMFIALFSFTYGGYSDISTKNNKYGKIIKENNYFSDNHQKLNNIANDFYFENISIKLMDKKNNGDERVDFLNKKQDKMNRYLELIDKAYKTGKWDKGKYLKYGYVIKEINNNISKEKEILKYTNKFKKLKDIKEKGRNNMEIMDIDVDIQGDFNKSQKKQFKKYMPKYISEVFYELEALGVLDKSEIDHFNNFKIVIKDKSQAKSTRFWVDKEKIVYSIDNGFNDFTSNKKGFKGIIYHELGHHMDLNKIDGDEFEDICWKSKNDKKSSCENGKEFIQREHIYDVANRKPIFFYSRENKLEDFAVTFSHTFHMLPKAYYSDDINLLNITSNNINEKVKKKIEYMLTLSDYSL